MEDYDYTYETIEKIIVKRSLTEKKYLGIMTEIFDKRWFDQDKNLALILGMAVEYYKKFGKIPENRILQCLIKKRAEKDKNPDTAVNLNNCLMQLDSFNIPLNDECADRNIEKYINEKGLYFAISDNISEITHHGNVDNCLKRFERIQKITFRDDDLGMSFFDEKDMKKHWDHIKNPDAKIPTGWDGIDRYTSGGFYKEGRMLACFMGQAGLGKSLFLSNISTNFLRQNKTVVVISLEMSEDVYAQRFDAHISNVNINRLKDNSEIALTNIKNFYQKYPNANLIIKEYPPRSVKTSDIEIYLDKLVENGIKFDVVVVDYLNLVLPKLKSDNMYQGILAVTEELRSLSYKYETPIVTATQANSQGMNNSEIGMEHVSESRGIAHTVDFLGALYQTDDDREHQVINMRILKNRLGGNVGKVIPFRMDPQTLVLTDMTFSQSDVTSESEADQLTQNLPSLQQEINDL